MPVGYTKDPGRFLSQTKVRPGYHGILCVDAATHQPKKESSYGNIMFVSKWRVLTDPEDQNSIAGPEMRNYSTLPLDNLAVKGHVAPDWSVNMCVEFFSALWEDEVPDYPRFSKEHGMYIWNGEPLDKSMFSQAKAQSQQAVQKKAMEIWGNDGEEIPRFLIGQRVFCEVSYPDNDLEKFPNLNKFRSSPESDWELETDPFVKICADFEQLEKLSSSTQSAPAFPQ
jgi:hypothetical protein